MKAPYFLLTRMDGEREIPTTEIPATKGRNGWFWTEVPEINYTPFAVYVVEPETDPRITDPCDAVLGHLSLRGQPVPFAEVKALATRGALPKICFQAEP